MAEATASAAQIDADDEPPALNALQENIARRGNNAYYYAHGHRNDAPAWDGDPSPMKLETTAAPPERRRCAITRYSWLDEDTKIRIYIPVDDERFQRPDAITLTWTEKSVVLAADLGDEVHTFAVPALYDTIVGASHKRHDTRSDFAEQEVSKTNKFWLQVLLIVNGTLFALAPRLFFIVIIELIYDDLGSLPPTRTR